MTFTIDRQNRQLINNVNDSSPVSFDSVYQGDIIPMSILVANTITGSYSIVTNSSSSLVVSIGVPGIVTSSILAANTMSYYSASLYTGSLVLTGSSITTYLSSSTYSDVTANIRYSDTIKNTSQVIYSSPVTLFADLIK